MPVKVGKRFYTRPSYVLLGDGMDLKVRAFKVIQEQAAKAA